MTDSKMNSMENELHGTSIDDDLRDASLETALRGAYELMDPTPEQESRMLDALLKAQAETGATEANAAPANVTTVSPQRNRAKRVQPWKIALPLAACFIVGAIVIGVSSTGPFTSNAPTAGLSEKGTPTATTTESVQQDGYEEDALVMGESAAEEYGTDAIDLSNKYAQSTSTDETGSDTDCIDVMPEPENHNTEEYNAIQERGFVSTKTTPLSTVAADVDTASYCNLRRMINDGCTLEDIPTGAVRIEEMLNYFDYDYPAPSGDDKFSITAQAAPCPWNSDTQLLVLGFASAPESKAADRGSNLVFLVDVSGSMDSPDKLDLLQDSFATLLESLGPNDRVSIVTYANGEDIVLEGAHGDDSTQIIRAIYKLRADGSTNGEAGLKQAYEVAQRNFIEGGVNRIIMASDGDLNVGMTSESDLHDYVDKQRETGIYLSVLGFGSGNYKDNKMETLADHGNGSYHYIDCIDEAKRVLTQNLTANLVPFADNVKVQVEFNPAQVKGYRLIGYDNRMLAAEDFRDDSVDAGDVGPGAQFTVAYEVALADSPLEINETELKYGNSSSSYASASSDWLTCTMRYHEFDGDQMREQEKTVDASAVAASPSADWNFAASVIEFGMLAHHSKYAGAASIDSALGLLGGELSDERAGFKELVQKTR